MHSRFAGSWADLTYDANDDRVQGPRCRLACCLSRHGKSNSTTQISRAEKQTQTDAAVEEQFSRYASQSKVEVMPEHVIGLVS